MKCKIELNVSGEKTLVWTKINKSVSQSEHVGLGQETQFNTEISTAANALLCAVIITCKISQPVQKFGESCAARHSASETKRYCLIRKQAKTMLF